MAAQLPWKVTIKRLETTYKVLGSLLKTPGAISVLGAPHEALGPREQLLGDDCLLL